MYIDSIIRDLHEGLSEEAKIRAVDQLKPHLDNCLVLTALCCASLKTDSARLREHLIAALRSAATIANLCFKHAAERSNCARTRRWAFLNLSMMGCRTAKQAVIAGLNDPKREVWEAAALNIGLYQDHDYLLEVERFFERHRFHFAKIGICQFCAYIGRGIRERLARRRMQVAMGL